MVENIDLESKESLLDRAFQVMMEMKDWSRNRKEKNYDTRILDEAVDVLREVIIKGRKVPI